MAVMTYKEQCLGMFRAANHDLELEAVHSKINPDDFHFSSAVVECRWLGFWQAMQLVEQREQHTLRVAGTQSSLTFASVSAIAWDASKCWYPPESPAREKGTEMMLIVSEIAEAMEGARKDLMDDKLPHRKMEEVEMADAVIRIMNHCTTYNLDLEGAIIEKAAYNKERIDHRHEVRALADGKKF